jgi:hypothetical protein
MGKSRPAVRRGLLGAHAFSSVMSLGDGPRELEPTPRSQQALKRTSTSSDSRNIGDAHPPAQSQHADTISTERSRLGSEPVRIPFWRGTAGVLRSAQCFFMRRPMARRRARSLAKLPRQADTLCLLKSPFLLRLPCGLDLPHGLNRLVGESFMPARLRCSGIH